METYMFRLYVILQNEYSHENCNYHWLWLRKKQTSFSFHHRKSCMLLNVTIFENNAVAISVLVFAAPTDQSQNVQLLHMICEYLASTSTNEALIARQDPITSMRPFGGVSHRYMPTQRFSNLLKFIHNRERITNVHVPTGPQDSVHLKHNGRNIASDYKEPKVFMWCDVCLNVSSQKVREYLFRSTEKSPAAWIMS